jgi:COP9 signalosome complex subunit 4
MLNLVIFSCQITADGLTISEKAMIEHNLTAAAKLYDNIKITELAILLNLDPKRTEKVRF